MTIASKIAALLTAIRRQDVEELAPAERQRLANLCRHVAALAEPRPSPQAAPPPPRAGVLYDLKVGSRAD